jgi:methylmalonyl-CoA epimerase
MKIDHIGIAVEDLDEAVKLYERLLGLLVTHRERVADFEVDTATFEPEGTSIELVQGTSEGSTVRKFVKTRGPGIHHIAFEVEDIEVALADLKAKGVRLIDERPRRGIGNSRVAFIHPGSTQRVLCELIQPDPGKRGRTR